MDSTGQSVGRMKDQARATRAAIILGTIGVLSFIVQPGLVQGFVTDLGVDEAVANELAFSEMLGIALATVIAALIGSNVSWRLQTIIALCIAVLGNVFSAIAPDIGTLSIARSIAGFGAGFVISISFTVIGAGARAERNLGLYLVALLTYGAFGLWAMPTILDAFSLTVVFSAWALASALAIIPARSLPHRPETSLASSISQSPGVKDASTVMMVTVLLGVLIYNISVGIAWANLFLIGIDAGLREQPIANALLICQFTAVAGALGAVWFAERTGRFWPIAIGTLGGAAAIALVLGHPDYIAFLLALIAFNTLWNFAMPFILGLAASLTAGGRLLTVAVSAQMVGLAFGPLMASALLGESGGFEQVKWASIALMIATLLLLALPLRDSRLRLNRAAA